ncbi:MAG: hypothetical protein ABI824_16710 [Acidobacteriota bacterium]
MRRDHASSAGRGERYLYKSVGLEPDLPDGLAHLGAVVLAQGHQASVPRADAKASQPYRAVAAQSVGLQVALPESGRQGERVGATDYLALRHWNADLMEMRNGLVRVQSATTEPDGTELGAAHRALPKDELDHAQSAGLTPEVRMDEVPGAAAAACWARWDAERRALPKRARGCLENLETESQAPLRKYPSRDGALARTVAVAAPGLKSKDSEQQG